MPLPIKKELITELRSFLAGGQICTIISISAVNGIELDIDS